MRLHGSCPPSEEWQRTDRQLRLSPSSEQARPAKPFWPMQSQTTFGFRREQRGGMGNDHRKTAWSMNLSQNSEQVARVPQDGHSGLETP